MTSSEENQERHAGYGWLLFCAVGLITSLTLYGIVLEYATIGGRKMHEASFIFVTTSTYTITAYFARWIFGEKPTDISKYQMLVLSCTSIASTFTSIRSLRYVIFPVQVLFKSCKPVPVMVFGTVLGKRYPIQKYVNVVIITTGVALFMGGAASSNENEISAEKLLGAEVDGHCFLQLSEEDFEYLGYSKGEIEVLVALRNRLKGSTSDRDAHRADMSTCRSKQQQGGGGGSAAARLHNGLSFPIQYQSPDVNEELLYGELIVVGYSDYRLSSHNEYVPVGTANERFQLKRRALSNGKKIARVDSNCFTDEKCEEKEDSRSGFTTRAADENKRTSNIFLGNSMKVSLVDDPSVDCFQLGRDLYNDFSVPGPRHISDGQKIAGPVPRQACRIICERSFPYRCYIYAGGFDENGAMQVPQERVIIKSKPLDGVSRYGLYMWSPARKEWAEISVLGNSYPSRIFKPCRKHPDVDSSEISRTSIGSLAGRPMNQLIDGSLLDIGGVVLLFRNRGILFDNDMESPLTVVAEFNAMNPQCPVMMHTLYFCHFSLLERKIRSEQRLRETSDLTYNSHRVPFVDESDIPEDRRPYVFPSCGHVHGYSKSLVGRPCPLCRTSGAFVPVSLTFEESFGSGTPSHVFNPCGHVASLECCESWSSIRVPAIGCPFFSRDTCAACPFCRTTLNTQTPFSKLILQSNLTGNSSPGA